MATRPTRRIALGSVAAAAVVATAFGQQAAQAKPSEDSQQAGVQKAMQRDLGLSAGQAKERLAQEKAAAKDQKALTSKLGSSYAGSWFDAKAGSLVVAVTSAKSSAAVRDAGAKAVTVQRSAQQLDSTKAKLDKAKAKASKQVAGWFVDAKANTVVVKGDAAAAKSFVKKAGVSPSSVKVKSTPDRPQPLAQGGDAYYIGSARCSIGFAVSGGFISAGHCGNAGDTTSSPSGTFEGSVFPGSDYSFISTSTAIEGTVANDSGSVAVAGSEEAPVGSSICRSGSTTGWQCGEITGLDATVNYQEGEVSGLIQTDACAEPGDSGGSAISGDQAQGVTSGGSGDCSSGGETFFQPVNEILDAYDLTLTTG